MHNTMLRWITGALLAAVTFAAAAQNNIKVTPARLHPMHLGGVRLSVNMLRTTLHKDHPHRFECA